MLQRKRCRDTHPPSYHLMQVRLPSLFLALTFTHLILPCSLLSFSFKQRTHGECINNVIQYRFYCLSLALSHSCLSWSHLFNFLFPSRVRLSCSHLTLSFSLTLRSLSHSHSSFLIAFRGTLSDNTSTILSSDKVAVLISLCLVFLSFLHRRTGRGCMLSGWWHVYHYTCDPNTVDHSVSEQNCQRCPLSYHLNGKLSVIV